MHKQRAGTLPAARPCVGAADGIGMTAGTASPLMIHALAALPAIVR